MTTINDITPAVSSSSGSNSSASSLPGGNLDQAAFLRLMTAQLKMQDPFKPLDNNQMVGQMAQFSTVAGIGEMNNALQKLSQSSRIGDASSWLGRHVLLPGNMAVPGATGQYAGEFSLDADAANLSIDFLNSSGEIVQAIELGEQDAGPIAFEWDARDSDGQPLDLGPLKIRVNGGVISDLSSWTTVDAVQSPADAANARLLTPRGEFAVSDAIRLS